MVEFSWPRQGIQRERNLGIGEMGGGLLVLKDIFHRSVMQSTGHIIASVSQKGSWVSVFQQLHGPVAFEVLQVLWSGSS